MQNLKNFIRHGKQARQTHSPHGEATTNVSNVHAQQQRYNNYAPPANKDQHVQPHPAGHTEPNLAQQHTVHHQHQDIPQGAAGGFSVAAGGDNRNVAAKAGDAAARAADDAQARKAKKDVDPSVLERIVAEERESKGKLPKYPGLERYELIEKMGDGAFSNVYRAKDTHGKYPEVAIKVVRKFEMNSSQVSYVSQTPPNSEIYFRCCIPFHYTNTIYILSELRSFANTILLLQGDAILHPDFKEKQKKDPKGVEVRRIPYLSCCSLCAADCSMS